MQDANTKDMVFWRCGDDAADLRMHDARSGDFWSWGRRAGSPCRAQAALHDRRPMTRMHRDQSVIIRRSGDRLRNAKTISLCSILHDFSVQGATEYFNPVAPEGTSRPETNRDQSRPCRRNFAYRPLDVFH